MRPLPSRFKHSLPILLLLLFFCQYALSTHIFSLPKLDTPQPLMPEICDNEIDDDGDGLIDCFDPDCGGNGNCVDFYFGEPTPDCRYVPPTATSFELELIYKTDHINFPIDQRCAAYVGDLDGDGIPEIVSKDPNRARLQIFSGATGASVQSIAIGGNHPFSQVALADVDRNGSGDIFVMENTVLARYEFGSNTAVWKTGTNIGANVNVASPQVADFDNDGIPEVYVRNRIFSSQTGSRLVNGSGNVGAYGTNNNGDSWPIAFDLFQQGDARPGGGTFGAEADGLEFIAGNEVYLVDLGNSPVDNGSMTRVSRVTGTNIGDGFTSIADLDNDGEMDIVVLDGGRIYAWNPRTQTQIGTTYDIPSTNSGGRINIGDFDGDGQVEIGTAGRNRYVVLEYVPGAGNGSLAVKWQKTGLDDGSQRTGSTLFDFDGDGSMEVVYSEEGNLFIYRGSDGQELTRIPSEAGTRTEYPLVADVNGDGAAEIIVTAEDGNAPSFSGSGWVSVYRAKTAPWVSARPVWHQHGLNPTYINDDLTVPRFQQDPLHPSFAGAYNNFLVQSTLLTRTSVPAFEATDAVVRFDSASGEGCPNASKLCYMIANQGDAILPGITSVAFYDADPSVGTANVLQVVNLGVDIAIDDSALVCFTIDITGKTLPLDVWIMVNDTGFANADLPFDLNNDFPVTGTSECDFTNNLATGTIPICIELCENGIDDDGDGLIDEPNIANTQTSGCSGAGLPQFTVDIPRGLWSVLSDIGTTSDQNGNIILGQNDAPTFNEDTIIYTAQGCTDTVYVSTGDSVAPAISCPGNANRNVDVNCMYSLADFTATTTSSDNCTDVSSIILSQNPGPGTNLGPGQTIIIITAKDKAGNSNDCSFSITVNDNIAPAIICPTNLTLPANGQCEAALADYTSDASVSDNCSSLANISLSQNPLPGAILAGAGANQVVVLTAQDEAGNSTQCIFSITLTDTTAPQLNCPATQNLLADSDCETRLPDYCGQATVLDNCSAANQVSLVQSPPGGTVLPSPGFPAQITITATDNAGNSHHCQFTVTLSDQTPPAIACPAPQTIAVDASCNAAIPDLRTLATISDNCSDAPQISISQSPAVGNMLTGDGTTTTITLTAQDQAGNNASCDFVLSLADSTAPVINCPGPTDIFAQTGCDAVIPDFTAISASDNCSSAGQISISQLPAANTVVNGAGAVRTVSLTPTDAAGNSETCGFAVTVQDSTAPVITCPGNQLLSVNGACPVNLPDYTQNVGATDNCAVGSGINLSQVPLPGTSFSGDGTIVSVTVTAADADGNAVSCSFSVELDDATNPTITCPGNQDELVDANCEFVIPDYSALADAFSACLPLSAITITQAPVGITLNGHNTSQIITLTADNGTSTNSCTFTLTISDQTKPDLLCPLSDEVTVDANCEISLLDYTGSAVASDNCAASVHVSQAPSSGTTVSGAGTVQTVTIFASDGNGNDTSCTFSVTLKDTINPALACPPVQTLYVDEDCEATIPGLLNGATASDNCTAVGDINLIQSPPAGTVLTGPTGSTTVSITATDERGNATNCQLVLTLADTTSPLVVCPSNQQLTADAACSAAIPDYRNIVVASDNCTASAGLTLSQDNGGSDTLTGAGTTQMITITAVDGNGNSSACTFSVNLIDTNPPSISCPANQIQELDGACEASLDDYRSGAVVSDNCTPGGSLVLGQTPGPGTAVAGHNTVQPVTITVDDASGNMLSCSFNVTLIDTTRPVISCPSPNAISLDQNCDARLPDYRSLATVADECAMPAALSLSEQPAPNTLIAGDSTATAVTISATDENGNIASCSFTVLASDSLAPIVLCPDTQAVSLDANCEAIIPDLTSTATASDNCDASSEIIVSQSPLGTLLSGEGTTIAIMLTATDQRGNASSCMFMLRAVDNEPPSIQCPETQNLAYNDTCSLVIPDFTDSAIVADNCAALPILVRQLPTAGTVVDNSLRQRTVRLTADDEFGNTASCDFVISLNDTTSPSILCPASDTLLLDANCEVMMPDFTQRGTVSDNCAAASGITVTQLPNVGALLAGDDEDIVVMLTASDGNGNADSCSFIINLQDSISPSIQCPANQTLYVDDACPVDLPNFSDSVRVSDNCALAPSIVISQTPNIGSSFQSNGTIIPVTVTADDQHGNTKACSFIVTLSDTSAPEVRCPAPITEYVNGNCEFVVPDYSALVVLDNTCQNPTGISTVQRPVGLVVSGHLTTETIFLISTDNAGNKDSCSFILNLADSTAPLIVCPADTTQFLDVHCEALLGDYSSEATVADNCSITDSITVSQQAVAGTLVTGDDAERIVSLQARDAAGNTANCSFIVTFQDTISPGIICPPDQEIFADADCEAVIGDYRPKANVSDNCEGSVQISISQMPAIGTVASGAGTVQIVVLAADDNNNNQSDCNFTVTVRDTSRPAITCPPSVVIPVDGSCTILLPDYRDSATVSDNCSLTTGLNIAQLPIPTTSFSGHNTNQNITLTVSDESGNSSDCSFSITLSDTTKPGVICPNPPVLPTDAACERSLPDYTSAASLSDNCSLPAAMAVSQSPEAGTVLRGAETEVSVTLTATDEAGNSMACTFVQQLSDTTKPNLTCPANDTIGVDGNCPIPLPDYQANVSILDNCASSFTTSQRPAAATIFSGDGTLIPVTISGTDESGNTDSCTFVISLVDQTNPTIICPGNQTEFLDGSCQLPIGDYTSLAQASSECNTGSSIVVTQLPVSGGTVITSHSTSTSITLTATDASNNSTQCTFLVTADDTLRPSLSCPASDTVYANDSCEQNLADYRGQALVADNCTSVPTLSQSPAAGTLLAGTGNVFPVSITADDGNGNDTLCSFNVSLLDTTRPSLSCPGALVLDVDENCEVRVPNIVPNASAQDNCSASASITLRQQPQADSTLLGASLDLNITVLAVDESGNSSRCIVPISTRDQIDPTVLCPDLQTLYADGSCSASLLDYTGLAIAKDNCT
jgi:hypothetical protein